MNRTPWLLMSIIFCTCFFGEARADAQVDSVLDSWHTFKDSEHLKFDYTLFETLEYPDKTAYVLEYETPEGENKRLYRYLFVDHDDNFLYEISLGTYDFTTKVDREMGNIGEDERLYHLDVYCPDREDDNGVPMWGSHKTLGFFKAPMALERLTKNIFDKEKGQVRCK